VKLAARSPLILYFLDTTLPPCVPVNLSFLPSVVCCLGAFLSNGVGNLLVSSQRSADRSARVVDSGGALLTPARPPACPPLLEVCAGLSVYSEKKLVWSWFVCDRRSPSFDVCWKDLFAGDFLVLKKASVNPVTLCLSKWTLLS
jgi:hypothetical protein